MCVEEVDHAMSPGRQRVVQHMIAGPPFSGVGPLLTRFGLVFRGLGFWAGAVEFPPTEGKGVRLCWEYARLTGPEKASDARYRQHCTLVLWCHARVQEGVDSVETVPPNSAEILECFP